MDRERFGRWLAAYAAAWEARNPEAAAALFTEDARYHWTPFAEPKRGRAAIAEAWRQATERQADVRVRFEVLAVSEIRGLARWRTEFTRPSGERRVQLDGVLLAEFAMNGLCREFREWWHTDEAAG